MNKNQNPALRQSSRAVVAFAVLSILLAGCAGEDGAPGAPGAPGTPSVGTSSSATSLTFAVNSVTIASPPVVKFTMTNEDGVRFTGLAQGQVRFTLAKLVPGTNGSPHAWQSYINRKETKGAGAWGAGGTAIQATSESNGTLVNNLDGTYTYTFANDVKNITTPLAVTWEPTLTHRLGVQISGGDLPVTNAAYDWRPSDGATTGLVENDIVQTASCNECHGKLAVHGGGRVETKYCVTCHNPGSKDANSGNTVDFKVMIHKIHRAADLPSRPGPDGILNDNPTTPADESADNQPYTIWGFNDTKFDFSEVTYPQDIRNCSKCHDSADTPTPQAHYWEDVPNRAACSSCHDDVDFATGAGHTPSNVPEPDDSQCAVCHSSTGFPGAVASTHEIPAKVFGAKYQFAITNVDFNPVDPLDLSQGGYPKVTYKVTDPTNGNAPYNLLSTSDLRWACVTGTSNTNCTAGASRLAIDIAWTTPEITNTCDPADASFPTVPAPCQTTDKSTISGTTYTGPGYGTAPGSVISLNALGSSSGNNGAIDSSQFATNGTFTVTSLRHVPGAVGTLRVAIEGHPAGDYDGDGKYTDRVPVKGVLVDEAVEDAAPVPRRSVVDIAKCNKCHDQLSLHGSNRTDEPQLCALCHNPNNTDVAQRRANANTASNIWPAPDGLAEQSVDFKYMVHAIHGAAKRTKPYVVYGNSNSTNDFAEVTYPGVLNNCATCHTGTTYEVPLKAEVLATSFGTGASRTSPADDEKTTVTAAVCSACHDTGTAETHMAQNGAQFSIIGPNGSAETCEICHGSGRIADVAVVHAVQ